LKADSARNQHQAEHHHSRIWTSLKTARVVEFLEVHNRWLDFLKFPFQEMCTSNLGFQFYCNEEKTTHCFYAFCDGRNGKNISILSFMLDGLAPNFNEALSRI
jgi:hypothetical protein